MLEKEDIKYWAELTGYCPMWPNTVINLEVT
jgi:hypothetical protein